MTTSERNTFFTTSLLVFVSFLQGLTGGGCCDDPDDAAAGGGGTAATATAAASASCLRDEVDGATLASPWNF